MLKFVKLNPKNLSYMNPDGSMVSVPRPSVIPFNIIDIDKIKAVGYAHDITLVIFKNDEFNPSHEFHFL